MVSRSLGLAALSLCSLVLGCASRDPSTMVRVPSNGPYPQVRDERTGVLAAVELLADGRYATSLRRIDGAEYTTLTPPLPDDAASRLASVAWFEDGALVGDLDGHVFRFRDGTWETLSLAGCDPTLPHAMLADARAMNDAWVLATDYTSAATLCHFDGETMDTTEALDFVARQIVEVDGALIATDSNDHVRRRRAGETEWATLRSVAEDPGTLGELLARSDAAYVHYDGDRWWRITASDQERMDAMPGMNGERYRLEVEETTVHECHYSLWSDATLCSDVAQTVDYHVLRVDGEPAVEVGYLHLERPDITWYVPMIVGPGQFLLAGSSGQIYVTVPPTSTP